MTVGTPSSPTRPSDQAARLRELVDELMADTVDGPVTPPASPNIAEPSARPTVVTTAAASSFIESRRPPSTAAALQPVVSSGKIVAITSGKGGVGKTFTSVNLSIALARLGCRVTLVDADPGLANADVICGLAPTRRLGDSGREPRTLGDLAIRVPSGFDLIPGAVGRTDSANESAYDGHPHERRLAQGLRELVHRNEVIVLDTGAGLSSDVTSVTALADLVLIVVTPEPTSMADAYAMIKCLRGLPAGHDARSLVPRPRLGLVVNQATSRAEASAVHARLSAVCERFLFYSPALLGVISRDERVTRSIRARRPLLADDSGAATAAAGGPARREITWLSLRLASELGLSRSKLPQPEGLISRWRRRLTRDTSGPHEELT